MYSVKCEVHNWLTDEALEKLINDNWHERGEPPSLVFLAALQLQALRNERK